VRLVVVGGGPLATYALERLAALLVPPCDVEVAVVERTGCFGAGAVHSDAQPATSVMNRVAGQIALGADETFLDWCTARGVAIGAREAPERRVHGRALRDAFDGCVERLRARDGVSVELLAGEAVDVEPASGGFLVRLERGDVLAADRVLFATGHSWSLPAPGSRTELLAAACDAPGEPQRRFVRPVYPLESQLDEAAVPAGAAVGLLGLGLTAIDVALHLTEGRGGRFVEGDGGSLAYERGGREPAAIVGACPSGVPVGCRPLNEKAEAGTALDHRAVFLTRAAIRALRTAVGRPATLPDGLVRQLDFDAQVLPLLVLELAYVYHATLLGPTAGAAMRTACAPHVRAFAGGACAGVEPLLTPLEASVAPLLRPGVPRFDWRRALDPLPAQVARGGGEAWRSAALTHMAEDVARAARGNLHDPLKAAHDGVWRDLRGELCEAADRGGLTAASQQRFAAVHLRRYNRLSNGAALPAMRKLLALARAGVLDLSVGPVPSVAPAPRRPAFHVRGTRTGVLREVDVLIEARSEPFDAALDARPLYPALLRRGLVRRWRNPGAAGEEDFVPGALDLDERFHPRMRDGSVEPRLTFLGAPAEGLVHFGQTAARPGGAVLELAAAWAGELTAEAAAPLAAVR
jgi:hypothetical protein